MGSEGPRTIFHVTGFKRFQGVHENPTEVLVSELEEHMARNGGMPAGSVLGSCTVLETAASGGLKALLELLDNAQEEEVRPCKLDANVDGEDTSLSAAPLANKAPPRANEVPPRIVWVHFGVNSGASKFALERRAVNEASFRCPDEMGWQPHKQPIVPEDGGMNHCRETKLNADLFVRSLRVRGFDVALSDDAGRFVCNYVYYQSLRHAEANGNMSVFIHVPTFAVVSKEQQFWFVENVLELLANCAWSDQGSLREHTYSQ
ncbi:hypothetical protein CBR_g37642 [Chara braunii]|uniref:Pyroglutamyl-peptidase I n=1 Tax=Chara braunii TaxID=69332 RepID=A0A388LNQ0_CHABU|nr:hypothetical protein CBR_g37642 [Chara braunii]|eukprot:GBG83843.1 hypothetical protein CBR_g37642 [Chara braunii]